MQSEGLGAVVRLKGPGFPDWSGFPIDAALRHTIDYSLENAADISGSPEPEILLIGTSAGGGAVAAVAADYERISRILLMAPGSNIGMRKIINSLSRFTGEVYIVIGDQDDNVGTDSGQIYYDLAVNAGKRELLIIPGCDHNFSQNGRIMSQTAIYALTKTTKPHFPDPEAGIILY